MEVTDNQGADDVVVSVPIAGVMAEADTLMNPDGMLVFFAGVPTSGLTIDDQQQVVDLADHGLLSPESIVGAVGGMREAKEGLRALVEGRYSGKVIIYPQIRDLPLTGLGELKETMPDVAEKLGPGDMWTNEAEKALLEKMLEE